MAAVEKLVTQHLDLWTTAIKRKSTAGRGSSSKVELYGIKKLRGLILELAVRGLLVPQDPKDEPASELLKKIAAEKAKLVNEGKIKREINLPRLSEIEIPTDIPSGWAPVRLGVTFLSINSGGTPSKSNPLFWGGEIPWASVKDLGVKRELATTQDYITEAGLNAGSRMADIGDLLICTRMGLGKVAVLKKPMAYNQDLKAVKLTKYCNVEYFLNAYATVKIKGAGTTVEGIKQERLLEYPFALPPLAEQRRIVAKVDELMALCDQLEQQTDASLSAHQTLVTTVLSALTSAPDHAHFANSWQRIAEHFDTLFATEESIDLLKQTILQLAVMGKLVPQDPDDEHASSLVKRAKAEKTRLLECGLLRKERNVLSSAPVDVLFAAPPGWAWVKKADVVNFLNGYAFKSEWFSPQGVSLLRNINVGHGEIDWREKVCIPEEMADEFAAFTLSVGDLVLTLDRPIISTGLKIAVVGHGDLPCLLLQRVAKLSSYAGVVSIGYLSIWLNSKFFVDVIDPGRSNGVPHISTVQVGAMPIALPPLAEQHCIVAIVDELMAVCDQLKARLADAQTTQLHLADALGEQALAEA